jgi:hypothetical protein
MEKSREPGPRRSSGKRGRPVTEIKLRVFIHHDDAPWQPSADYTQEMHDRAMARIAKKREMEDTEGVYLAYVDVLFRAFLRRLERESERRTNTEASEAPICEPVSSSTRTKARNAERQRASTQLSDQNY